MKRAPLLLPILLVSGAVGANAAFAGLGAVFDYPEVLSLPTGEIMQRFSEHQAAVMSWFGLLLLGAALLAPIAWLVGRLPAGRAMRWAVPIGIAAATVQVIGLSRWLILVPGLAARGDVETFRQANLILGGYVGETAGYALTALWTALVSVTVVRGWAGWRILGYLASGLIATGMLAVAHVPVVSLLNFAGYLLWSAWLVVFAIMSRRVREHAPDSGLPR